MDFELSLFDTQPAQVWGLADEFLSAPRLDNQIHCFAALKALLERAAAAPPTASDVSTIALCGSTHHGSTHYGSTDYGSTHYGSTHYGSTHYGSTH
eukprot:scaffold28659_cov59-Phaeocystis_antarctica.AAC.6